MPLAQNSYIWTIEAMSTPPIDIAAAANDITAQLQETNPPAVLQIRRIVEKIGIEAAYEFLRQTLEVEAQGGTLTADKTRRRTPCGTYFYIVRGQIPVETRNILWPRTKRPSRNSPQETSKETAKTAGPKEMFSFPKSRPAQIGGFGLTPQNGSIQIFPQILPLVATLKTWPNRLIFRFLFLSLYLW